MQPATSIASAPLPPPRPAAPEAKPAKPEVKPAKPDVKPAKPDADPAKPDAPVLDVPASHFPDDILDPDGTRKKHLRAPWEER